MMSPNGDISGISSEQKAPITQTELRTIEKAENQEIATGLLEKFPYGIRRIPLEDGSDAAVFDCRLLYLTKGAEPFYQAYQETIPDFEGTTKEMFLENNGRTCFVFSKDGMVRITRNSPDNSYLHMSDDEVKHVIIKLQTEVVKTGTSISPTIITLKDYSAKIYHRGLFDEKINPEFKNGSLRTMLRAINNLTKEESSKNKIPIPVNTPTPKKPEGETVADILAKL